MSVEYAALAAHWQFFHPLYQAEVNNWPSPAVEIGKEKLTGLPIIQRQKVSEVRMVKGINKSIQPLAVIVNDDGDLVACYDEETLAEGWNVLSKKEVFIRDCGWTLPVYEEIGHWPDSILVKDGKALFSLVGTHDFATLDVSFKHDKNTYIFPCPVYDCEVIENRPSQPPLGYDDGWDDWTVPGGMGRGFSKRWSPTMPYVFKNTKATCGYDSTEDYLHSVFGIRLHHSDKDWYIDDKRVIASGLPAQHTLEVISELVFPYHVEVDEVWTDKAVWYEEFNTWVDKLVVDGPIYQVMKQAGADLPQPRWHVGHPPAGIPLVLMTTGEQGGGHASYLGPRSKRPAVYQMAMTFRRTK